MIACHTPPWEFGAQCFEADTKATQDLSPLADNDVSHNTYPTTVPDLPNPPIKAEKEKPTRPLWLEVVGTFGQALVAPVLAAAILYYGNISTRATSRDDVQEKYVSIAVDVLKGKRDSSNDEIFSWAAKTLNKYAEMPFSEAAIKQLENGSLSGTPLVFDVSRQDALNGGLGNVYLTITNTTPDPVTIKSVTLLGSDNLKPPCKLSVFIDPMASIAFSNQPHSLKLVGTEALAKCVQAASMVGSDYHLVDVSNPVEFDAYEKVLGRAYSTINVPFGVHVEYEGASGKGETLFAANLHYLMEAPVVVSRADANGRRAR